MWLATRRSTTGGALWRSFTSATRSSGSYSWARPERALQHHVQRLQGAAGQGQVHQGEPLISLRRHPDLTALGHNVIIALTFVSTLSLIMQSLLIITGSIGAGKTSTLYEASDLLAERQIAHAAIDLDALGIVYLLPSASQQWSNGSEGVNQG